MILTIGMITHKAASGYIGWWIFSTSGPMNLLTLNRGIFPVQAVVVSDDFEFPGDRVQIQNRIIGVSIAVVVDSNVTGDA